MKYGKKCTEVRPLEVTLFSERSRCFAVSAEMRRQWFHDYGKQNMTKIPAACFRQAYSWYRTSKHYRVAWPTWCSTGIQRGAQQDSPAVVSYYTHTIRPFLTRKLFKEILGLEGSNNFLEKIRYVHNLMISDRLLRSKISLGKKSSNSPSRRNFQAQNFLETRKFYEEILGSLDNRTEISARGVPLPSTGWCLYCCTYTRLCSLLYSHMHRVTQMLPQEPWRTCVGGLLYSLEWWLTFFVFSPDSSRRGWLIIPGPDMQGELSNNSCERTSTRW